MAVADEGGAARIDLAGFLEAAEAAAPVDAIDAVSRRLIEVLAADEVNFLIADFSGDALIRLGHVRAEATRRVEDETGERVEIGGTPQGEALLGQRSQVVCDDGRCWVHAPVTNRGEAIGVLELRLPGEPDADQQAIIDRAAHALAYVVIANRRFTDLFEWGQRSIPLSLAAEIQHRLLPGPYTCEAGQFTLAAWLEPAGEIGGDTFDFSLDRNALHLSITDAMGHLVSASLLATLLVGSIRNGRRRGAGLVEQARLADGALNEHADGSQFATGQLLRVDLTDGTAEVVNAGHPLPLRLRGEAVDEVALDADPPFGAFEGSRYTAQSLTLEPGDRLLFLTDGVLERAAADADIRAVLRDTRAAHPRQAVQQLIQAAVDACGGSLTDDATALCLDWHGGPPRDRTSQAGADR